MQQKTTKLFAVLAVIILTITSCGNPKELIYQDVQNFRVLTLSLEPQIGMDVQFYNPNTFGMSLKDANIDVYINEKLIGKTSLDKKYSVPAQDTFLLPVTLTANLKNVVANAYSLLSNKEVTVRLQGSVKAGKGAFVTIPINYTGRQRLNVADFK